MTLSDIMNKCAGFSCEEERCMTDEYGEVVVNNEVLPQWEAVFVSFLGEPVSPVGMPPTREDEKLTKPFGGVRVNQTLYKRMTDTEIVIVMLWPWGDGAHTTLRMARLVK